MSATKIENYMCPTAMQNDSKAKKAKKLHEVTTLYSWPGINNEFSYEYIHRTPRCLKIIFL